MLLSSHVSAIEPMQNACSASGTAVCRVEISIEERRQSREARQREADAKFQALHPSLCKGKQDTSVSPRYQKQHTEELLDFLYVLA